MNDKTPTQEEQLKNLEAGLRKLSEALIYKPKMGSLDYSLISSVEVQIATIKTIRHQLQQALDFKVQFSVNHEVMQRLKIIGMEEHIRNAMEMLPET